MKVGDIVRQNNSLIEMKRKGKTQPASKMIGVVVEAGSNHRGRGSSCAQEADEPAVETCGESHRDEPGGVGDGHGVGCAVAHRVLLRGGMPNFLSGTPSRRDSAKSDTSSHELFPLFASNHRSLHDILLLQHTITKPVLVLSPATTRE